MPISSLAETPSEAVSAERAPLRWSRRVAADLVGFLDALCVIVGAIVPAVIYQSNGGLPIHWPKYLQLCLVSALIVYGCLRSYGMYDINRMHEFPTDAKRLGASLSIAFFAMLGLGSPFAPQDVHLWIWFSAWLSISFMLLLHVRHAARHVLAKMTRAGAFASSIAVYGSGTVARRVQEHLGNPALGIRFAGLYDDRGDSKRVDGDAPEIRGRLSDLINRARTGEIDRIIVALPQGADLRTQYIVRRLEQLPVSLHVVTHIASDLVDEEAQHRVSSLGPVGLIDVKPKPLADWSRLVKNVEDRVLGPLLLLLVWPLLALIALAIKLDSSGPVLFWQRRRGLNHDVFEVAKFRTMHVLEDGADVRQATRNDQRVTRVGWFLRRLSLDELPQLLNVLRGEMSLVGPRPHALAHDEKFEEILARYANRNQVKPGLTGLAQVKGFRGEIETPEMLEKRLEQDLAYVANWSLWLDVKIMLLTPIRCFTSKSAY